MVPIAGLDGTIFFISLGSTSSIITRMNLWKRE